MKEYDFEKTPVVDVINNIIVDATNKGASDIHFDPHENSLKIRIRIDGDLSDYAIVDKKYEKNLITRVKLLSGMNITESRLPQDGTIKGTISGKDLDLRVSAMPTCFGEKIVIRILDYSMSLEGLESLGFTKENYDKIVKMLQVPNGIILITGATGSGKSTTVYSMLQRLNNEETNIITVEDPVEMNIDGMNQVQVNSEIGLDFATVLRTILRQDPNVILIGEIRDSETAKIAVRASITGHLVLSTLHTNNSLTTIERLVDMDVERYLLSSSLKGVISQTLAKKLCSCKIKRKASLAEKQIIKKALGIDVEEIYDRNTKGCEHCKNGYKGRIAIQEVLLISDEISNAINNNIDREELKNLIYNKGHARTILQDGLIKVIAGFTTINEVIRLVDVDTDATNVYGNLTSSVPTNINKDYNNDVIIKNSVNINEKPTTISNNLADYTEPNISKNINNDATIDNNVTTDKKLTTFSSNLTDHTIPKINENINNDATLKNNVNTNEKTTTVNVFDALFKNKDNPSTNTNVNNTNNNIKSEAIKANVNSIENYNRSIQQTSTNTSTNPFKKDIYTNPSVKKENDEFDALFNNYNTSTDIGKPIKTKTDNLISLIDESILK